MILIVCVAGAEEERKERDEQVKSEEIERG